MKIPKDITLIFERSQLPTILLCAVFIACGYLLRRLLLEWQFWLNHQVWTSWLLLSKLCAAFKITRTDCHCNTAKNITNSYLWVENNSSHFCYLQYGSQVSYEVVFNLSSMLASLKTKRWNGPVIRNQLMNHADWLLKCIFLLSIVQNEQSVMGF